MDGELRPPPRRPDATPGPLRNQDFRKLLETPRPGDKPNLGGQQPHDKGERKAKPSGGGGPKRPPKPHGKQKGADAEGEDEAQQYRDRAEERRRGVAPDYDHVASDLAAIITGGQADLNSISVEDSKFLGGDVEHTHLVKGLDFALLQKVKNELSKGAPAQPDAEAEGRAATKAAAIAQRGGEVRILTAAGRAVYDTLFRPPRVNVAELFLPRRTAFVYELHDPWAGDMPATLRRSKADCPPARECMLGNVDGQVLERLGKILSYVRVSAGKGKKLKKKEKAALMQQAGLITSGAAALRESGIALRQVDALSTVPPAERPVPQGVSGEEDDIFGDAGTDYVPEVPKKAKPLSNGAALLQPPPPPPPPMDVEAGPTRPPPGYDVASAYADMELEDGEVPPPPPPPLPADGAYAGPSRPPPGYDAAAHVYAEPAPGPARPPAGYDAQAAYATAYAEPTATVDNELDEAEALLDAHLANDGTTAAAPVGGEAGTSRAERRRRKREDEAAAAEARGGGGGEEEARGLGGTVAELDAYAECYPGYHEYGTAIIDSDEEEGPRLRGAEQEEGGAAPKASKAVGARKEAKKQDSKLNTELSKIKGMLTDKYGSRHASAFERGAKQREGRAAPEELLAPGARSKRVRL